jgi:hypothetical protein
LGIIVFCQKVFSLRHGEYGGIRNFAIAVTIAKVSKMPKNEDILHFRYFENGEVRHFRQFSKFFRYQMAKLAVMTSLVSTNSL